MGFEPRWALTHPVFEIAFLRYVKGEFNNTRLQTTSSRQSITYPADLCHATALDDVSIRTSSCAHLKSDDDDEVDILPITKQFRSRDAWWLTASKGGFALTLTEIAQILSALQPATLIAEFQAGAVHSIEALDAEV